MRSSGRQLSPAALNGLLVSVDGVEVANTHAIKAVGYVVEASEIIKVVITMVEEGVVGGWSKPASAASTVRTLGIKPMALFFS